MKRYYVIFSGQVQGVGFRYTAYQSAVRNNCTGWVRNLPNGYVDMELQGETLNCLQVLHELTANKRYIQVEDYSMREIDLKPQERNFDYHF